MTGSRVYHFSGGFAPQASTGRVTSSCFVDRQRLAGDGLPARWSAGQKITDIPSACDERLARGEVDAGLIPAVEAARIPGLRIVRGVGIASRERVRSVLLCSHQPLEEARTVALDASSRSSAAMVQVLFQDLYGRRPEFHPAHPDLPEMLRTHDAALLIGDPALKADLSGLHVLDLAEAWNRLTGLPFVFAVWAVRPDVSPEAFLWSRDYGKRHMSEILDAAERRTGLPRALLAERGLAEFYRRAFRIGLIPSPDLPPFAGVPLVPKRQG
jgi:predicted solute-binding protein